MRKKQLTNNLLAHIGGLAHKYGNVCLHNPCCNISYCLLLSGIACRVRAIGIAMPSVVAVDGWNGKYYYKILQGAQYFDLIARQVWSIWNPSETGYNSL